MKEDIESAYRKCTENVVRLLESSQEARDAFDKLQLVISGELTYSEWIRWCDQELGKEKNENY